MKISLAWERPLRLLDGSRENLIYMVNFEKLPRAAGIYVFGRRFGKSFEGSMLARRTRFRAGEEPVKQSPTHAAP